MATTAYLRRMNQRRVVEAMIRMGKASRIELARISGMSQPTVSRIVDSLLTEGILIEAGTSQDDAATEQSGAGRPSTSLRLDNRRPRFGVVQVGVRKTRLAVLPI